MERCEDCGKNKKRYRSAFSSWICDSCKKEVFDYEHPEAFIKVQIREWWNNLPIAKKVEIYKKQTYVEHSESPSQRENPSDASSNIEKPKHQ